MTDALQRNSELTFPHLTVVSASAGSGKTTALTKRYVQFLLSDRVQNRKPQHLLAITFTNNAAAEMKQRILLMLKQLALGRAKDAEEMSLLSGIDAAHLPERAHRILEDILDDYSAFQVRTIDSFLATVFRSTAIDLGYSPSVELKLHPDHLIRESFRTFGLKMAQQEETMAMIRLLAERADEGRAVRKKYQWDPFSKVGDRVLDLYHQVASLGKPIVIPETTKEREQLNPAIQRTGEALRELLERSGLPPYKLLVNDLDLITAADIRTVCSRAPKKKATNKPKNAAEREAEETFGEEITGLLTRLNALLSDYAMLDARSYYAPYAQTLQMMDEILTETKKQENIVFLDDVNAALRTFMVRNIVPEMYIKLGEKIHHFLIDEFQDTSPSQWEALFPLLENSLAEQGSLFVVGDMKQSIYSFRGADWRIMRDLMTKHIFPSAPATVRTLETNYRSKPQLLDATREVFQERVAESDFKDAAEATGLLSYQLDPAPEANGGHVSVEHLIKDPLHPPEFDRVVTLLNDAHMRGNAWGDIAVLAPTNAAVIELSSRLNSKGIPFVSQSSLDIRNRAVIGELLACLRFLDAPVDDAAFASFVLGRIVAKIEPELHTADIRTCFLRRSEEGQGTPLYKVFQETFPDVWDRRFEQLFQNVGFLPLYDLATAIVGIFDVLKTFPKEEASVIRFLECVREFEATGNNAVRDFVKEATEGTEGLSWELPRPSGQESVTLMTIHKAKGLGFHVVIVLQYDWRNRGGRPAIQDHGEGVELVRIGPGSDRNDQLHQMKEEALLNYRADELNKLYVALTRARSEMHVLVVSDDPEKKPPSIFLQPREQKASPTVLDRPTAIPSSQADIHFPVQTPRMTEPQESEMKDREIHRGDLIHRILARIELVTDLPDQLAAALHFSQPDAAPEEKASITETLSAFLAHPSVRPYFLPKQDRVVWCERDVADERGRLFRIDRLIIDPEEITIVDYKTGGRNSERTYREQVLGYIRICRELFPEKRISGLIAYVDKRELVSIV